MLVKNTSLPLGKPDFPAYHVKYRTAAIGQA